MPLSHRDYTVACICPMGVELAPVKAMLDQPHPNLPTQRDQNSYTLGEIGEHNIVIAVLPEIGTNSAATVAIQLLNDFPSIRFGLLVGIGGGVPDEEEDGNDIRLGDVVVSKPTASFGNFLCGCGWQDVPPLAQTGKPSGDLIFGACCVKLVTFPDLIRWRGEQFRFIRLGIGRLQFPRNRAVGILRFFDFRFLDFHAVDKFLVFMGLPLHAETYSQDSAPTTGPKAYSHGSKCLVTSTENSAIARYSSRNMVSYF